MLILKEPRFTPTTSNNHSTLLCWLAAPLRLLAKYSEKRGHIFNVFSSTLENRLFQASHLMRGCVAGTTSISAISPVQLVCCGKSTLTSLPFGLIDTTVPTLPWFTDPHLYLGVVTEDLTRTRSPTFISSRRAAKEQK